MIAIIRFAENAPAAFANYVTKSRCEQPAVMSAFTLAAFPNCTAIMFALFFSIEGEIKQLIGSLVWGVHPI